MYICIYVYIYKMRNTSYFIEILFTTELFRMASVELATIHVQYFRKHTDGKDYLKSVKCIFVS